MSPHSDIEPPTVTPLLHLLRLKGAFVPRNRQSVPHSRPSPSRSGRATLTPVPNHQSLDAGPYRLSKSRFTSGLQCHKLLWWTVHEPNAVELQPDKVLQDLFDQATR